MAERPRTDAETPVTINRAPVLALWAAVVAERLGYDRDEAVTLGRAVSGMNAAAKARALGLATAPEGPKARKKARAPVHAGRSEVALCNRLVPVMRTPVGVRALAHGKPGAPETARRYLESKFGDRLGDVRAAMTALARSMGPDDLAARAFELYEAFRPRIPSGTRGWGAKGVLDLGRIRALRAGGRSS